MCEPPPHRHLSQDIQNNSSSVIRLSVYVRWVAIGQPQKDLSFLLPYIRVQCPLSLSKLPLHSLPRSAVRDRRRSYHQAPPRQNHIPDRVIPLSRLTCRRVASFAQATSLGGSLDCGPLASFNDGSLVPEGLPPTFFPE